MIHDVSTDADDPPQFIALRDLRLKCENGVDYSGLKGEQHHQQHPHIAPAAFHQSPAVIFHAALAAASTMGWAIAAEVEAEGRIEATATTRLLRFKDDVVIRIRAFGTTGDGALLDIRSASRVGSSDLGANAKRIHMFFLELNNRLKTIS
jgi:uncharacterized protein (DUF1499 family)